MTRPRCLIWVQSLLGSGHLRRTLLVAEALAEDGFGVTLVNGGPPSPWPVPPGVEINQLPSLQAAGLDFRRLIAADGGPDTPELRAQRRDRLLALDAERRPEIVITELFPFGRRAFRDELLPLLDQASRRTPRPLVLASVRDILVSKPEPAKLRWMRDCCLERYDAVLIHGDPTLFPFELSFPHAAELARHLLYTGFVLTPAQPGGGSSPVVVSAGGGAVGGQLLRAAAAARPLTTLASAPWLLVGGANLPPVERERLQALLTPGVTLAGHVDGLASLMGEAEVSVSQAGYNTVAEALAFAARMVLVPFAAEGEDEQTRRAARLAELGLAVMLPESGLTPEALAVAIDEAAGRPRPEPGCFAFDGARRTAALIRDLLARHG